MVAEGSHLLAFFIVPNLDHIIGARAGEQLAVGFPTHVQNMVRMSLERLDELAGLHVEDFDEFVGGAGGDLGAVRAKASAENLVAVAAFDVMNQAACGGVENLDFTILSRRATPRCH